MNEKVVIIGAGQLGSRHLQALAKVKRRLKIQVVDTSKESLDMASSRFNEVADDFDGSIEFFNKITDLDSDIDVAIIATNSRIRGTVTMELLNTARNVRNLILEKVLFTKRDEYDSINNLIKNKGVNAWVNCPRRIQPVYQYLKKELNNKAFRLIVTGNGWGLGCNSIHFLDLFSYLSNENTFIIEADGLDKEIIPSKRKGFIEFTGTLHGMIRESGYEVTISCHKMGSSPLICFIDTEDARYIVQEEGPKAILYSFTAKDGWQRREDVFPMLFQSQLTHLLINSILNTGTCAITPYAESMQHHLTFINIIMEFQTMVENKEIKECLIT